VRQGLISALTDYTAVYQRAARRHPQRVEGPGQQRRLPQQDDRHDAHADHLDCGKWLDDMNNTTLTEEQRAIAKKNYTELIRTAGFPNSPMAARWSTAPRSRPRDLQGPPRTRPRQAVRRFPAR